MIDRVIICGVRRANEKLPISDIKQSIGRAGRSYTKSGQAYILVPQNDENYAWQCFNEEPSPILSNMGNVENVAFHILPWINCIYDEESYNRWYSKTLSYVQGVVVSWSDVKDYLYQNKIVANGVLSDLGRVSLNLYIEPRKLINMRQKLLETHSNGNTTTPLSLSWIFANEHISIGDADATELYLYKNELSHYGYTFENGQLIQGYAYFCLMTNKKPSWLKHIMISEKDNLGRLFSAVEMLSNIEHLSLNSQLSTTRISVFKKVPIEIAELMNRFDIDNKNVANELFSMGVTNVSELKHKEEYIALYGSEQLKQSLKDAGFLKNFIILEEQERNNGFIGRNRK